MTAVFDLDDTICRHDNRAYSTASPIMPTIEKIKRLKKDGWEIIIYTARGQHSCNGNLPLIEERNRLTVEIWLKEHDVPYDRIVFGKPLGDIYVDDKGISLENFLASDCQKFKGNSGSQIYRIGDTIIKKCKNASDQAKWYKEAAAMGVNVPEVYSVVLNGIYTNFIQGESGASRNIDKSDLCKLLSTVMLFSLKKKGYFFSTEALSRRVKEHLSTTRSGHDFNQLFTYLKTNSEYYRDNSSMCHGDLSLSNTIFADDRVFLIDPIISENYSSYLMDLAKIRFSLDDGECFLNTENFQNYAPALAEMDLILSENQILEKITALEATYWLRLLKYTEDPERKAVAINKAKELEGLL